MFTTEMDIFAPICDENEYGKIGLNLLDKSYMGVKSKQKLKFYFDYYEIFNKQLDTNVIDIILLMADIPHYYSCNLWISEREIQENGNGKDFNLDNLSLNITPYQDKLTTIIYKIIVNSQTKLDMKYIRNHQLIHYMKVYYRRNDAEVLVEKPEKIYVGDNSNWLPGYIGKPYCIEEEEEPKIVRKVAREAEDSSRVKTTERTVVENKVMIEVGDKKYKADDIIDIALKYSYQNR